jgi:hypothetical protein
MLRKILGVAATLALPALLVAQAPGTPNTNASATAKEKTAAAHGKAKHRRGDVVGKEDGDRDRDDRVKNDKKEDKDRDRDDRSKARNPNAATPAKPATPAVPAHGEGPATPAKPATPAVPAHKAGTPTRRP